MTKKQKSKLTVAAVGTGIVLAGYFVYKKMQTPTYTTPNPPISPKIGDTWQSADGNTFKATTDANGKIQWTPVILGVLDTISTIFGKGGNSGNPFGGNQSNSNPFSSGFNSGGNNPFSSYTPFSGGFH